MVIPRRKSKAPIAVARTLAWADEAAARDDFQDALAWLSTLESVGHTVPPEYEIKREQWRSLDQERSG